jgi:hypothetical protein
MPTSLLTDFAPDPERLAIFRDCIEHYDVGDPAAEWPNNLLSRKTVVYGSGAIACQGNPVRHAVDPHELRYCRQLAAQAILVMGNMPVGMGSESIDPFLPFFIVANQNEPIPEQITPGLIWAKFGGTIFPLASITVEPLQEAGIWWTEVRADGGAEAEGDEEESNNSDGAEVGNDLTAYLRPWRTTMLWFQEQPAFRATAFVRIGEFDALHALPEEQLPAGTKLVGCVLPRLMLGLTHQGSLVGGFGWTVQT